MSGYQRDTEAVLHRFNEAFLRHDPGGLTDLVAEDCVIENTRPAPDGSRHEGRDACIALWSQIATAPGTWFEPETVEAFGDSGIIRWRFHWGAGTKDSVRGVNLMRLRDGFIIQAQGYIKGT